MARILVYAGQIAAGIIATADIGDSQITSGKIAGDAIDGSKLADNAVDSEHIAAGAIDAGHLSSGAIAAATDSLFFVEPVASADRSNPSANFETVTSDAEWGFDSTAGVIASGTTEGYPVLLENASGAAGAHHFNTTAGTPNIGSDEDDYKINVYGSSGEEIVDGSGNRVWAILTVATARAANNATKLRFFSGEFGPSASPYTMGQAYFLAYPKLSKLTNVSRTAFRNETVKLSKTAAGVLGGSIGTAELEDDAVTAAKLADGAIDAAAKFGAGVVDNTALGADAVNGAKIADDAIDSEHIADGAIDAAHLAADIIDGTKIADDAVNSEHIAAGAIDPEHFAASAVETAAIASGAVTEAKLAAAVLLRDVEVSGPIGANGGVCNQSTATAGKVTAQGSPDMTVAVAAGTVYNSLGARIAGGADAALVIGAADGSNPRYDLVSFSASGVATVTAGTPGASPSVPSLPAGHVKLAVVLVGTGVTSIGNAVIFDHRAPAAPVWRQESFVGDGSNLLFALSRRARGDVLFFRGMAPQQIVGSPDDADEVALTDAVEQDGSLLSYGTGLAPANGEVLTAMYWG